MSYSFSASGKSRDEVKAAVAAQFDTVLASQPIHARDKDAALNAVNAFVDLVTIPEGRTANVSVSGSVGWSGDLGNDVNAVELNGAGLNVSVHLA